MSDSRDDVLARLERIRKEYIAQARVAAEMIAAEKDDTCTVDDVRAVCPPPEHVDGRVMGAIFNTPEWEFVQYERSRRDICHKRPIARFRYVGERKSAA